MNDREFLEAAAKAVGINFKCFVDEVTDYDSPHYGISAIQLGSTWNTWNPLEDDGDALRLAVDLRLSIDLAVRSTAEETQRGSTFSLQHFVAHSATRRAIVHAAAMIGTKP
jgi:hypothetical protein